MNLAFDLAGPLIEAKLRGTGALPGRRVTYGCAQTGWFGAIAAACQNANCTCFTDERYGEADLVSLTSSVQSFYYKADCLSKKI